MLILILGEINIFCGNKNWMCVCEGVMQFDIFGDEFEDFYLVVEDGGFDFVVFDNVLEFFIINGVFFFLEVVMFMVFEVWQGNSVMDFKKVVFYEWVVCQMEFWDGFVFFIFVDGCFCGVNFDCNGFCFCCFYVMDDDCIICVFEVGIIFVEFERIIQKGCLQFGCMFFVDIYVGCIIDDSEFKVVVFICQDFRFWFDENLIIMFNVLEKVGEDKSVVFVVKFDDFKFQEDFFLYVFGYIFEQVSLLFVLMVFDEKEVFGFMGNDVFFVCLFQVFKLFYEYFCQLFVQVINFFIDFIREFIVMFLECYVGFQGNFLEMDVFQCGRFFLFSFIFFIEEFNVLNNMFKFYFEWIVKIIDIIFFKIEGVQGYINYFDYICKEVIVVIEVCDCIIVLIDCNIFKDCVVVFVLLVFGMVYYYFVVNKWCFMVVFVVEIVEVCEVYYMCVFFGYGVDVINFYFVMECIFKFNKEKFIKKKFIDEQLIYNYKYFVDGGILKVMSKMGIFIFVSYKGVQIFEVFGVDDSVVDCCFCGIVFCIKGIIFEFIVEDVFCFYECGFFLCYIVGVVGFFEFGEYYWCDGGEVYINDFMLIVNIQDVVCIKNDKLYEVYFCFEYEQIKVCMFCGMFDFKFEEIIFIFIEQVEFWIEIVCCFCIGVMFYGFIFMEFYFIFVVVMNRFGGKFNIGEGGEDFECLQVMFNGDIMCFVIKQVVFGCFGVMFVYFVDFDEFQIKMVQGVKFGEGGELFGYKVFKFIVCICYLIFGVGLILFFFYYDIYLIEDLKQFIYDFKCLSFCLCVLVKFVFEIGVGIVVFGVVKVKVDYILIFGYDGGIGVLCWIGIKYVGFFWELGFVEIYQILVLNDFCGCVVVQIDGQFCIGCDVVFVCLFGVEEWGFVIIFLIVMGCIMVS